MALEMEGVLNSDVLRWMSDAHAGDEKKTKKKKEKFSLEIRYWLCQPKKGKWIRESVATTVKRTFQRFTHAKDSTKAKPVIVSQEVEELVYAHGGYRPSFEGEKETRKSFYHNGARVWR